MSTTFVAFIPLSNWLRGFDRYRMSYSKAAITESAHPDAFFMLDEDEPWAPGLEKARRLVTKLGRRGDRVVQLRARLPVGPGGMTPNVVTGTGIGWRWPSCEIPLAGLAWVGEFGQCSATRHEEVTAAAFRLADDGMGAWADCRPRSLSVLPVAQACDATCAFCFSKASVSDLARQRSATLEVQLAWADAARARGAERAVITGGGEPTLMAPDAMGALVRGLAERFPRTVLITNGSRLDTERIRSLRDAGLTTLALSRHGLDAAHDARIMGLSIASAALALEARRLGLRTRAVCVLQRGGVHDAEAVLRYLDRSSIDGFDEVCFKELYVSSLAENPWAEGTVNAFCAAHQVPLSTVTTTLMAAGFARTSTLPWGSPVYEGEARGGHIRVAAYTEPSVGWERTNRQVRSWNVMADGTCMASLEDPRSDLSLDNLQGMPDAGYFT
jgi:hypothetical protein